MVASFAATAIAGLSSAPSAGWATFGVSSCVTNIIITSTKPSSTSPAHSSASEGFETGSRGVGLDEPRKRSIVSEVRQILREIEIELKSPEEGVENE
jgi:hypothetical protein